MPLFHACLAIVAFNKIHTSTEIKIEGIAGLSLCQALQRTSGLFFCWTNFSSIQRNKRRAGVWPSKSHPPSWWTPMAWHEHNEGKGEEEQHGGTGLVSVLWGGVSVAEIFNPPGSCLCRQIAERKPTPDTRRCGRARLCRKWVWNNSC